MCWLRRGNDMSRVISDAEARRFRAQLIKFYTHEYEGEYGDDDEEKSAAAAAVAESAQLHNKETNKTVSWRDGIRIDTYRRMEQFQLFEKMSEDYFHYGNSNLYVSESAGKSAEANDHTNNDEDDEDNEEEKEEEEEKELRFELKHQAQKRAAQAQQEESRPMSKRFYSIFDKNQQRRNDRNDDDNGSSTSAAAVATAAAAAATTTATTTEEDELVTDDMVGAGYSNGPGSSRSGSNIVKAIYYLHDNEGSDRSCNLRNRIFLQFFSKFLYSAREFVICDHTGMPFHKSFRLIDPYTVK